MKGVLSLFLILFLLGASAEAAEYLYSDKGGNLYFRCGGVNSMNKTAVRYQGHGYYAVRGPYISYEAIKAPDAFEAAYKSCGEGLVNSYRFWLGLPSYKDS